MATLYEIDAAIMGCIDEETGEVINAETLDSLLMERSKKLEGVALWIKNLETDAKAIKEEKDAMDKRMKSAEKKAESLKKWLSDALCYLPFETPKVHITFRGGVLDFKETVEQQTGKNSFTAWNDAGKKQNLLINTLLSMDCHVIVTMRTKMAYAMEQNDRGKTVPVKIGLAPVQRENTEYEFDLVLNIARNHNAIVSKDTTFLDTWAGVITPELGSSLKNWLSNGIEPHRCADCGAVITAVKNRTADQIAEGTEKNYGRKLCWSA